MASPSMKLADSTAPEVEISRGDTEAPSPDSIAALAYEFWHARGCPEGSPEVDWFRAEQELRGRYQGEGESGPASTPESSGAES